MIFLIDFDEKVSILSKLLRKIFILLEPSKREIVTLLKLRKTFIFNSFPHGKVNQCLTNVNQCLTNIVET